MKTKAVLATTSAALALALAPSAFGQDYCVNDSACVNGGGVDEASLEDALAAAATNGIADRVLLGPGTYEAPTTSGFVSSTGGPVEIVGAGPGSTIITGPPETNTVLYLGTGTSRVADLEIVVPTASGSTTNYGVDGFGVNVDHVKITADPGTNSVTIGAALWADSVLHDSAIEMSLAGTTTTVGAQLLDGAVVEDTSVSAKRGLLFHDANVHVARTRITASQYGVMVRNSAVGNQLTDSLVHAVESGSGVYVSTGNDTDAGISLRGDTIIGGSSPGGRGVQVSSNTAHAGSATIDSTIIRGFQNAIHRSASAGTSDVAVSYSDFDPATVVDSPNPGALTIGLGNVNVDPLFASADDFHLVEGSPLLDAGNPADLGDASSTATTTASRDATWARTSCSRRSSRRPRRNPIRHRRPTRRLCSRRRPAAAAIRRAAVRRAAWTPAPPARPTPRPSARRATGCPRCSATCA